MTGEKVLLAEDDAGIRTVVSQALSRQGYEVQATSVAAALWRWIAAGEGDVVITDVALPDENTLDLLPRIRTLRPDLPVIVMSAQNTLLTAVRAAERGRLRVSAQAVRHRQSGGDGRSARCPSRQARAGRRPRTAVTRSSCRSSAARRRCRRSTGSSPG